LNGGSAYHKASTYTGQHNIQKNTDIMHASGVIRTHDPSVRVIQDQTRRRLRGHWGRLLRMSDYEIVFFKTSVHIFMGKYV